jgi:short subunit dehydrogenase-like uncharacterized protein
MAGQRDYDVVLFGATGFTGQLTARYIAKRYGGALTRWAIAGRDEGKLTRLFEELVAIDESCRDVGKIEADLSDEASLLAMAKRARVVATTAGPFIHYGEPVLSACVAAGADYVDITGEPEYVDMTLARYDEAAREKGVRAVSCCGFDSVPHDMGVFYTVKQLPPDVPITVEGFVRARGGMSGGTWTSAIEAMGRMRSARGQPRARRSPGDGRRVGGAKGGVRYEREIGRWVAPLPTIDPQVVKRSARALSEYGPDFRYGHHATFKRLPTLLGAGLGIASVALLAQTKPTRDLLFRIRRPGQGPTTDEIERGWFEVTFLADAGGERLKTRVGGGDPGYGDTAKMIAECALCLALDRDRIPDRAGVLTTAVAMGDALIPRLEGAGLRFETLS